MRIAVLTGDLIRSTDLPVAAQTRAFDALEHAARDVAAWQDTPTRFSRSRGDGWQVYLATPHRALRAALYFRAALTATEKGIETRIAIADGEGSAHPPEDLNTATGPAYTASGRALDALGGQATLIHTRGGALGAAVRLADHISRDWTQAQARAMRPMLAPDPPTRAEVGKRLNITRQAVDQALAAAGFAALNDALTLIEALD